MILLDLALELRPQTPIELRVVLIVQLFVLGAFYSVIPKWLSVQTSLAALPFQQFDWESSKYLKNKILRISSILSISIVYSIIAYSYLQSKKLQVFDFESLNVLLILALTIILTVVKVFANRAYFKMHNHSHLGDIIIDYQYSLNVLFSLVLGLIMVFDVFYLRMNSVVFYINMGIITILFLVKLFGTILLLQNKFDYPLVTVFIYLCTFEIAPALIIAKVLFVNS